MLSSVPVRANSFFTEVSNVLTNKATWITLVTMIAAIESHAQLKGSIIPTLLALLKGNKPAHGAKPTLNR